ncbi:ABC transporter ATP-binding protein [Glaciihabitans sp. dw_435]|uniref:ABC transporter ATP-binding protein n=1 Tax=Glaciihabitans sp. dw_435 TaxID=2720081 RepID=UPI001BD6A842|nr:ABC transporter ATP-binding protein [Glaciihabitans sp. dw_435]
MTASTATTPDIDCVDLVRIFRTKDVEVQALQGLTLRVNSGEMVAVVGASGSGKSTLLNVLSGLDRPSAGRAMVAGHDMLDMGRAERVRFQRSSVGFVWQQTSRNLLPFLTAAENIAAVLAIARGPKGDARAKRVDELLDLLEVGDVRDRMTAEMSGGQQQRVAIAVAIANDPSMLLADEPTGELDEATSEQVLAAMRRINEERGLTTLIVTHDATVAAQVRRTVQIRDGRTSTEVVRSTRIDDFGDEHAIAEEFAVLDRVGRMQLPATFTESLGLRDRVRLTLETDHVSVRPGIGESPEQNEGTDRVDAPAAPIPNGDPS